MSASADDYPKPYSPPPSRTHSGGATTTSVHVTALDGLVNVNSAVFVGLSLTTPGQHSLENPSACDAGVEVAKKLLVFEVVSFSFFLFSSLVAQGLKLAINLLNSRDVDEVFRAHINLKVLRFGMMASATGSVMGCLFCSPWSTSSRSASECCRAAANPPSPPWLFSSPPLFSFTSPQPFTLSCIDLTPSHRRVTSRVSLYRGYALSEVVGLICLSRCYILHLVFHFEVVYW